ncbi:MAG: PAS domain S-box protein [Bacteroidales bacterium]|nr:PAS domain S-box protein [Bacteroidales bacterium]
MNSIRKEWKSFRIVIIYIIIGALWIVFSDKVLGYFVSDSKTILKLQTIKGWFYVLSTGILLYYLIFRQLGKLEKANLRLKESEVRWASYVKNAPNIITVINTDLKIKYTNRINEVSTLDMFIGKDINNFIASESLLSALNAIKRTLSDGSINFYENLFIDDNNERWFTNKVGPVVIDNKIDSLIIISSDITEQKRIKEKLEVERELQSAIFDSIEEGIVVCDENGVLNRFNEATRRFHGLPEKPIPAEEWSQHYNLFFANGINPMKKEDVPLYRALKEGKVSNIEFVVKPVNGEHLSFVSSGKKLINKTGDCIGAMATMHNVTEQKKAENEIRDLYSKLEQKVKRRTEELEIKNKKITESQQALAFLLEDMNESSEQLRKTNEKLETANKEMEAFSYSVSHDLRAPLTRMAGFSSIISELYKDKLDEKGIHYLNRIIASSHKMEQLINDILSLSRISRQEIVKSEVDISVISEEIINKYQKAEPERITDIKIEESIKIFCDPKLITILLENILSNAWKFTSKNKKAIIEIGKAIINNTNVIFIKDNGVGFDVKYSDKVFLPFQRLHTESEFAGTGIGMATVKRIVRKHNAQINVESKIGRGTTFYLTFTNK